MFITRFKRSIKLALLLISLAASLSVAAEVGDTWYVAVPVGNARSEPTTTAELVVQLPKGTEVVELQRQGNWLEISTPNNEQAWMHLVTLSNSIKGVELFGQDLTQVNRQQMRAAIAKSPAYILRELDAYPYDLYDPSPWRKGATEMALGYTLKDKLFAVAEITFRSQDDTEQVRQIAEEVAKELGPWNRVLGRRASGPVEFEWRKGSIRVLVHRGWPDTSTYLVYEVPTNLQLMQQELNQE